MTSGATRRNGRGRAGHVLPVVLGLTGLSLPALADPLACGDLARLARSDLRITRAEAIPAGTLPADNPGRAALTGAARARAALPAHCLVEGTIDPRVGAGGVSYGIGFQLRLPEAWNGRFLFQGGGGLDGVVNEAIGAIPVSGATAPPALLRGYAVASTDSGHRGRDNADASFGLDQQARIDFAYGAIGTVAREAKGLIAARYGRAPAHAYFMGCSNGGRSALMAATRFPTAFDGIVAGAPAFRLTRAGLGQVWDTQAFLAAAPKDAEGRPILAESFSEADLALVAGAVLKACDAADGLADGMVDAVASCRFDPASLACPGDKTASCLGERQVEALRRAFRGAQDSQGKPVYAAWPWDPGLAAPGWRAWKLGTSKTAVPNARNATLGPAAIANYFLTPPDPGFDALRFDFDRDVARTAETAAINDPTGTFVSTFTARGGRLLVYQGVADPVFSARDLVAHWQALARDNGGAAALSERARLFLVPGMTHCGGGPALDDFDPLAAIESWVEGGKAPDTMPARGTAFPGRTRPLCPYPKEARYDGGEADKAESFACREP
ncbi:tannase/feruloyl esterase family alpha/beta hydrolase [Methylobacterium terricola]|uniref:Tannase/feruloyl esterase family alpha/beta hydrolase n=1 Tax=Methylobacterium terricola TaxID=2583531 RepID=A0A5C4L8L5_9HYPH|nr:tannase/feruloyl esterase family alpha/beta hydrolase [Methylobacterium terricola]TNC08659.1 tannase/feruloyl esterase family alpha/beta hydrolase [Methylobacterium terricola]